ncbi:hypothetical protein JHK85_024541 [Glycine max]|nr:hypothetical protein JHK85_024541 [Glycine max]KAG5011791.1 hypothetical protein JHK86_024052 [Glycine max]
MLQHLKKKVRQNAPVPPSAPRCSCFIPPSPSSSSSCPLHRYRLPMVVVDASSLRSSNANTSTLLSFESSSDRKLGAWFVTLVVVPTVEKKHLLLGYGLDTGLSENLRYGMPMLQRSACRKHNTNNGIFPSRQGRWVVQMPNDELEDRISVINSRDAASRYGGIMIVNYPKPQTRLDRSFKP